jgi:dihydrofolate reductase
MRKLIFAINVTIDGFADHTAVIADDELHDFYTSLLNDVDTLLFGRKTYQLMESYWPKASEDPQATKSTIEFANKINSLHKIVFSRTLDKANWNNTRLIKENIVEEVKKIKNQSGKNTSIGGLSTASIFLKEGLIDEYWFLVQPIVLGNGRRLFSQRDGSPESLNDRINLKLVEVKKFKSGVVALHYKKL